MTERLKQGLEEEELEDIPEEFLTEGLTPEEKIERAQQELDEFRKYKESELKRLEELYGTGFYFPMRGAHLPPAPCGQGLTVLDQNPTFVHHSMHPSRPMLSLEHRVGRTYGLPFREAFGLGGSREYKQRILDDSENYDLGRALGRSGRSTNFPYH